jgi:hypothetical protein
MNFSVYLLTRALVYAVFALPLGFPSLLACSIHDERIRVKKPPSVADVNFIANEIIEGLEFLKKQFIFNCELNASNVFVRYEHKTKRVLGVAIGNYDLGRWWGRTYAACIIAKRKPANKQTHSLTQPMPTASMHTEPHKTLHHSYSIAHSHSPH